MLKRENALLLVVDIQANLFPHILRHDEMADAVVRTIRGCKVLGVPVVVTEQYPKGLGPTVKEIQAEFDPFEPIVKSTFSCCGDGGFLDAIEKTGRKEIILCGIEAHVCIYQTARDLVEAGYDVHLLVDGISSRTQENRGVAIRKMENLGVHLTTMEMALFEMLVACDVPDFKPILKVVK